MKKINSSALMADAWHHRSDSLSSIGSFIGIFGARLGFPVLDSVASIVICIFILLTLFLFLKLQTFFHFPVDKFRTFYLLYVLYL